MRIILFANTDWYLYNFRLALIRDLVRKGHHPVLVSPGGQYSSRFAELGLEWHRFDFSRRGLNPFREGHTVLRLARLYKELKPDLVHHFTLKCVIYGGLAARLASIESRVNAVTGLGFVFSNRSLFAFMVRSGLVPVARVAMAGGEAVFQNPEDLATCEDLRIIPRERTHLVRGSGVDLARFAPTDRAGRQTCTVVMASRLLREKGVEDFIAAAELLRSRGLPIRFVLAGSSDSGNPSSFDAQTIERWGISGTVTLLGHVDDVAPLYQEADICVLPTYYGEGVPRSLVEAAASGLPLVASDVPGCREIVRSGINGVLVPKRDPAQLATSIQELAANATLRARYGANSRQIAVAEFSQESVIAQTLQVYQLAIGNTEK